MQDGHQEWQVLRWSSVQIAWARTMSITTYPNTAAASPF
eukprot:COSAG01_NODE_38624_length_487_cov_0.884021_1_plen_38_part_10